ncbi:MAG: hypothetical protein K0T00_2153 [Gaiellaceae bacterium]|nr:hypothetical protein [Gaiellaceae bacterium]
MGITRGFATLVGAAVAGFLIWVATQIGQGSAAEYWTTYGLVAAAGLTMALSQLLGGWTKWGWPRLSLGVFLIGFLPVLAVGGWVLLARQPADFFNTMNWSRDLGVDGFVGDLGELLAPIAFLIGLTFGFTFDTTGPREVEVDEVRRPEAYAGPVPVTGTDARSGHVVEDERVVTGAPERTAHHVGEDERWATTDAPAHDVDRRRAADEPLTAEREHTDDAEDAELAEAHERRGRFGFRRRRAATTNGEHRDEV